MSSRLLPSRLLLTALAAGGLFCLGACEEQKGGFGDAPPTVSNVEKQRAKDDKAGKNETPPDFDKALKLTPTFDKASGKVVVKMNVQKGFHAYAPGNEIGVPVDISVKEEGGWQLGEKTIPAGVEKDLGELGKAKVLEGTFDVAAAISGGSGEVEGSCMVQICTDNVCDRPRQHPFKLAVPEA
jgi:DsbC/DsbD-like thiol-disulfide interchange protein